MFDDTIWSSIKDRVEKKQWYKTVGESLMELCTQNTSVALHIENHLQVKEHTSVPRNGDIIVGFYLDSSNTTSVSYSISIGGYMACETTTIHPGEFRYCFENTHVFPLIGLQYSELKTITTDDCRNFKLVYACLGDIESRRHLGTCTNIFHFKNSTAILRSQYGGFQNEEEMNVYLEKYPDYNNVYTVIPNMSLL